MRVGFSQADITPTLPIALGGYSCRNGFARDIGAPLYIRVMAVEHKCVTWILISLDLLGVSVSFVDALREEFRAAPCNGNVSVVATHTHGAPNGLPEELDNGLWIDGRDHVPRAYLELVLSVSIRCARGALLSMRPAFLRWIVAEADGLYLNRRDPSLPIDRRIHSLIAETAEGHVLGGCIHAACHPTVVDPLTYSVTPDFPGYLTTALEKTHPDSVFLFLNGAAGDVSTRFTRREATAVEAERIGREMASAMGNARSLPSDDGLVFHQQEITLADRFNGESLRVRLQTLSLCGRNLIFIPGEVFAQYALDAAMQSPEALIIGYANGYLGYLPDLVSVGNSGYEIDVCRLNPPDIQQIADWIIYTAAKSG